MWQIARTGARRKAWKVTWTKKNSPRVRRPTASRPDPDSRPLELRLPLIRELVNTFLIGFYQYKKVEYRSVVGHSKYLVENDGSVWIIPKSPGRPWKRMKPYLGNHGYLCVGLQGEDGEKRKTRTIHTLVLEAFVGPRPIEKPHTRHLDSDTTNNNIDNIVWGTAKENYLDRVERGTDIKGETQGHSKLTEKDVINIRDLYEREVFNQYELADKYGVCVPNISTIISRKTWKHI